MKKVEQSKSRILQYKVDEVISVIERSRIDEQILHDYDASAVYVELSQSETKTAS